MSDAVAWIGLGVSVASVGVAIWALLSSRKAGQRAHGIDKRLLQIEEAREQDRIQGQARAVLCARIYRNPDMGRRLELRVENQGDGEAHDVNVTLDDQPVLSHPSVGNPSIRHVNSQEVRQVGPHSHFQYILAVNSSTPCPREIVTLQPNEAVSEHDLCFGRKKAGSWGPHAHNRLA